MNKVRLFTFLTGLLLALVGFYDAIFVSDSHSGASLYTPAILITIGGGLISAVRRK